MTFGFPGWRKVALPLGAGVVLASGQAPLGWVWVAFPALSLLIFAVARTTSRAESIWVAWAGGTAYFAATLGWIVSPFFVDPVRHGWMAPFALLGMAFGMALFWALAGGIASLSRYRALTFATALGAAELARGYVLTGFPWALVGHMWIDTPMAQMAAFVGPSGLTLATLLVAAVPMMTRRWAVPVVGAVAVGAFVIGTARLDMAAGPARDVSLRLVQPNAEQHLKWDPDQARIIFDRQLALTAAAPVADLTIWPETAVPYLLDRNPEVGQMIADAADGRAVIVGMQRVDGTQGWNTLAMIGADGTVQQHYDKWHLVPFGEYIPFGDLAYDWFGLQAFASQMGASYAAGSGPAVMDLGPDLGTIIPLICYEAVFPQDVNAAPDGADWILQITNDAWFGTLTGPWQHAAQARFRAIEQGLPLVRVANTGITAVYDARGRMVQFLPFGTEGALDLPAIPGALPPPPYARYGEIPLLLLLAGLGCGLIAAGHWRVPTVRQGSTGSTDPNA
jgi:apolipoprotein N-acyltransferase